MRKSNGDSIKPASGLGDIDITPMMGDRDSINEMQEMRDYTKNNGDGGGGPKYENLKDSDIYISTIISRHKWKILLLVTVLYILPLVVVLSIAVSRNSSVAPGVTQEEFQQHLDELSQLELKENMRKLKEVIGQLSDANSKFKTIQRDIEDQRIQIKSLREVDEEHTALSRIGRTARANLQSQINNNEKLLEHKFEQTNDKIAKVTRGLDETSQEITKTRNNHEEYSANMKRLMHDLVAGLNPEADPGKIASGDKSGNLTDFSIEILSVMDESLETCFNTEVLNITACDASSVYDSSHDCKKVYDGVLLTKEPGSAWWSQGGKNEWIELRFPEAVRVKEFRFLQKFATAEAVKKIELELDDNFHAEEVLKALDSKSWNLIRLKTSRKTRKVRVTIKEAESFINNGFKEIRISGCTEDKGSN